MTTAPCHSEISTTAAHRINHPINEIDTNRVVVKYRNQVGRIQVLEHTVCLHYDFDELDNIVCVTIPSTCLKLLELNPNIEHVVLDGRIGYCKW